MKFGIVLFTSDRGIAPAVCAKAAEEAGFHSFYVPEHTHIPVRRDAAHPLTGGADLPDDRYLRTLDPWVALGMAAAVTSRIRLATAVALPVESDPITLAKTIASLDFLSGGRVTLGAGFGGTPTSSPTTASRPSSATRRCASTWRRCARCGPRRSRHTTASTCPSAAAGPTRSRRSRTAPADRSRRHREELHLGRRQRGRLDHHAVRERHRRPGHPAQQVLGRRRALW